MIVFSDNIFALTKYAQALKKPLIYGGTSHAERTRVLHAFKHSPQVISFAVPATLKLFTSTRCPFTQHVCTESL